MKLYLYIDESGSIHKNSNTKYFAVGGYYTTEDTKDKIISKYKRSNLKMKFKKNLLRDNEIKSYDMSDEDKINIFGKIQNLDGFYGCTKIFNKSLISNDIIKPNIFFNYAVKILIKDCILPNFNNSDINEKIKFIINVDNRNINSNNLNDLSSYLKTEFCIDGFDFKVKYYDSKMNYGIQLADLIVNTFYNCYKDIGIVKGVIPYLNFKSFNVSTFPENKDFNEIIENEIDNYLVV